MNETELRDLAERTQQIVEMSQSIGWDLFVDRAHAELAKQQKRILGGRLSEQEYRRLSGWVEGASAILNLPAQARDEYMKARVRYEEQKEQDEAEAEEHEHVGA